MALSCGGPIRCATARRRRTTLITWLPRKDWKDTENGCASSSSKGQGVEMDIDILGILEFGGVLLLLVSLYAAFVQYHDWRVLRATRALLEQDNTDNRNAWRLYDADRWVAVFRTIMIVGMFIPAAVFIAIGFMNVVQHTYLGAAIEAIILVVELVLS